MQRFVCVHGHFYQPPRENPWLETVEQQDSAYPYHDWNERITEECYSPNAASRIMDKENRIAKIVNNYEKISFNFGPTLLSWLEINSKEVYQAILDADRESQRLFGGFGNAMAQAYNHMILPLSNSRDKFTQILWGIKDFEFRFKRKPLGMWLPETAVDIESLSIMAELGITFTILAQHQAKRCRRLEGSGQWHEITGGEISPTMPYLQQLPNGKKIVIFFYDGPVSQAAAFQDLLDSGEIFSERLLKIFSDKNNRAQLANISTDGETYGHHHRFGDMALAYALQRIENDKMATLTNYSQFLNNFPPTHEVEIHDNSSWSCAHGIERWKNACGCCIGSNAEWNQNWRAPLRDALDWLRDTIIPHVENKGKELFKDIWAARNDYLQVILDRSPKSVDNFLDQHACKDLNEWERQNALKLMELQRNAMLMYTSCGWFFDELSGIETTQIISYAARVIQLAENLFSQPFEGMFLEKLSYAKSNLKEFIDGNYIYQHYIKPSIVDWPRIGAYYAISSLFEAYPHNAQIFSYKIDSVTKRISSGYTKLVAGQGHFQSTITHETIELAFAAVHFGDQNLACAIKPLKDDSEFFKILDDITQKFDLEDFLRMNQLINQYFGPFTFSINSLFKDKQQWVLHKVLSHLLREIELNYQQNYRHHASLIRYINELGIPVPAPLKATAEYALITELKGELSKEKYKIKHISKLLSEIERLHIALNEVEIGFVVRKSLEAMIKQLSTDYESIQKFENLIHTIELVKRLPFKINFYHTQNEFYAMREKIYPGMKNLATEGDPKAKEWVQYFSLLGNQLEVYVP